MIKAIVFDFSRVLLNLREEGYVGSFNGRHDELKSSAGYNLFDHFELNEELLNLATKLKEKYSLYIFTTGHIHLEPEIQAKISHIFIKMYSLEDIGGKKDDPESFKKIAGLINQQPDEILFIDDTPENVQAAQVAGLETIQFINNEQLFKEIAVKLPA